MKWLLVAVLVVLLGGAASAFYGYSWVEREGRTAIQPGATETTEVEVARGATLLKIGEQLERDGFLRSALAWRLYWRLHPPTAEAKAGRHRLSRNMTMPELLAALGTNPIVDELPLTILEGWRLRDTDAYLAGERLITAGEYIRAASAPANFTLPFVEGDARFEGETLEGYLYPETYKVPRDGPLDLKRFIQRQVDTFHERFSGPRTGTIAASGRSLHGLVTMASMLEREEPKPRVRPKVAGVLWKRIDKGMPLGVDATSRYFLDDWNDRRAFLIKLRDPNDPYNTRLHTGLPPGPIGAPALPSLVAALKPERSPHWYYLHDNEQNIHFANDGAGHEENRRLYNVY